MRATLVKRASAYLIDLIIMIVALSFFSFLYHPDTSILDSQMDKITVDYITGDISFSDYFLTASNLYKQIDIANIFGTIINIVIIILYFVILPYFNKGRTIGKYYMHIEVKNKGNQPLNIFSLFIRNLIINGLIYLISVILCSLLVSSDYYFITITILGIIQITLLLISVIMVLTRKDRRGLHDIISSTWVSSSR